MGLAHRAMSASHERVPFRSWWMVAVLFAIYVLSFVDRQILSILVGPIKQALALSDLQMGLVLGPAFAVFFALFGLPLGWAADRCSRRWVIFFGVLLWSLATASTSLAQSFEALLLCRMLVGVGEAALLPAAYSLLADEFPRHRLTLATSIFQSAGTVGLASAYAIGGLALATAEALVRSGPPGLSGFSPWQLVMLMVGGPGLVMLLLVFSFREPPRRARAQAASADEATSAGGVRAFLRAHRTLMALMMLAFGSLAVCAYSTTVWVPAYVTRRFAWGPAEYGLMLSAVNIAASLALILQGRLVDILFARGVADAHLRFYSWVVVLSMPAAVLMFWTANVYVFFACYAVVLSTLAPLTLHMASITGLVAPSTIRGRLIAIFLFVFTVGGLGAGPAVVGALTDHVFRSEDQLGASLGCVLVVGMVIALACMRAALGSLRLAVSGSGSSASPGFTAPGTGPVT